MITHITGMLFSKKPPLLVIDLNGIGYEINAPMSTFYQLPNTGEQVTLLTHLSIREDAHTLFGFYTDQERNLFRALIKVSGVGPKLALTILSGIESDHFVRCIQTQDTSSLVGIPGIGKKTAERLIIEMRDALAQWQPNPASTEATQTSILDQNQTIEDAISALTALGYKPNDAKRAVSKVHLPEHDSEQLIRLALKQMARRT